MLVIGLTGGIGMGKSAAAEHFSESRSAAFVILHQQDISYHS